MEKTLFDTIESNNISNKKREITEYSVSQISQRLKNCVESNFSNIRVRGELSRVTIAKSGHMYSSLKDENAVLDIICWRGNMPNLSVRPEEGLEVVCSGRLTTYAGRSNYQMIINTMELAGEGALLRMLEGRKKKLAAEGLFDLDRKKQIPVMPSIIGVVTSPTGAVIRDIMHRISDRFPTRVLLYPAIVQGDEAAEQVIGGIKVFNGIKDKLLRPDVIIIARGGGSLEDLMPFNDEKLVRAVAGSQIPIISAIGHETDTSLSDYAADLRAPTPTAAAEMAVPVKAEVEETITMLATRASRAMRVKIDNLRNLIDGLGRGLGEPNRLLENSVQRLDQISIRLDLSLKNWLASRNSYLDKLKYSLSANSILIKITNYNQKLDIIGQRLTLATERKLQKTEQELRHISSMLETLSFKKVLSRGFVLAKDKKTGQTINRAEMLKQGDNMELQFYDGEVDVIVDKVNV